MRRRGRVIHPRFKQLPGRPHNGMDDAECRGVNEVRKKISRENIAQFYTHLFAKVLGGRVMRTHESYKGYCHSLGFSVDGAQFFPDLVRVRKNKVTLEEVKAVHVNAGKPWFGFHQYAAYCKALLEVPDSEMVAGIFSYGDSTHKMMGEKIKRTERMHLCKHETHHLGGNYSCKNWEKCGSISQKCLVDKLSGSTNSLLVLPHNLLSFLLSISRVEQADQTTSHTNRDKENYYRPYGTWLHALHDGYENPQEAISGILNGKLGGGKFDQQRILDTLPNPEDFMLESLKARQYNFSSRVLCQGKRVKPFRVTVYENPRLGQWRDHFYEHLDEFLSGLGIYSIFHKQGHDADPIPEPKQVVEVHQPALIPVDNIPF